MLLLFFFNFIWTVFTEKKKFINLFFSNLILKKKKQEQLILGELELFLDYRLGQRIFQIISAQKINR